MQNCMQSVTGTVPNKRDGHKPVKLSVQATNPSSLGEVAHKALRMHLCWRRSFPFAVRTLRRRHGSLWCLRCCCWRCLGPPWRCCCFFGWRWFGFHWRRCLCSGLILWDCWHCFHSHLLLASYIQKADIVNNTNDGANDDDVDQAGGLYCS